MARIQILQLPEGAGDDRPPFVLVFDEWTSGEYVPYANIAQQTGARGVIVFEETVRIPANEEPIGADGYPVRVQVEGDFEKFREQVQAEIARAQAEVTDALRQVRQP